MPECPARRRRSTVAAAAVSLLVPLAGCTGSGDELDVDGFSPGACSDVASTLQEIDSALRELDGEDVAPQEVGQRFREAQATLKERTASAQDPVGASATELVTRLGFFRIAVDSNSYDGSQAEDVRTALEALAEDCRES